MNEKSIPAMQNGTHLHHQRKGALTMFVQSTNKHVNYLVMETFKTVFSVTASLLIALWLRRHPLMKRHKHLQSLAARAILFLTMAVAVVHANAAPPTQNVNVVNTPTVNVENTASTPVPISSEPGRDPFQESFVVILASGVANDGVFEVVPPGKRAVIEHVSVYATGTNAATADYFITSTIGGNSAFREVPIVTALSPSGAVIGSQSYRAFADPQTEFGAVIRRQNTTNPVVASFVITGYFVPAP